MDKTTKAMELLTPLGTVRVEADGTPIPFMLTQLGPLEYIGPDIAGRYRIDVDYVPDEQEHYLSCVLYPNQSITGGSESGENLECGGYYSVDERIKVSIGLHADGRYYWHNGKQCRNESFDYDAEITERGNAFQNEYITLPITKTTHYVFGVCWILDCNSEREVQTWYGADPWIMMQDHPVEISYGGYLYKTVTVETDTGKCFSGDVCSFGCSIDGREKYEREEPYIEVYNGADITVLFEHDIRRITVLQANTAEDRYAAREDSPMERYVYCGIEIEGISTVYSYISDIGEIPVGTYVEVPFGRENMKRIGVVRYCGRFSEQDAPYPVRQTKHIVRVVSDEVFADDAVVFPALVRSAVESPAPHDHNSAPWIRFDLGVADVHLRISGYTNSEKIDWDDRWCQVNLTVEGGSGFINYSISSDIMLSGEAETLEILAEELLNGKMTEPYTKELLEPELRFVFRPEEFAMDLQIILWDDAPTENYISLRFYDEHLESFLMYLQLITKKLSMTSPQVRKSIEADILRP